MPIPEDDLSTSAGSRPVVPRPTREIVVGSRAITGIFIILLLGAIHYAQQVMLPIVVALLLFFVFMPVQRRLQRLGLHGHAVAAVLVLGLLTGIGVLFFMLSGPVGQVAENLPEILQDVSSRIEAAREAFISTAQAIRGGEESDVPEMRPVPLGSGDGDANGDEDEDDLLMSTATGAVVYLAEAPAVVAQVIFVLVLLFFLLSSSDQMYRKIIESFDGFKDKRAAFTALREVESKLGGYLGTVALINAGLGICIGLAMWALGMPVPVLFGVLGFVLNFIPFLGAVMGVLLSSAVALLWFDTLPAVLAVGGAYLALTTIEGQVITPALLAHRLRLNTAIVVLTIALWAWMWSFMGMVIAVPVLVALRVISEQIPRWHKVANFLSK